MEYELTKVKQRINKVVMDMSIDKNTDKEILNEVISIMNKIGRILSNKAQTKPPIARGFSSQKGNNVLIEKSLFIYLS